MRDFGLGARAPVAMVRWVPRWQVLARDHGMPACDSGDLKEKAQARPTQIDAIPARVPGAIFP